MTTDSISAYTDSLRYDASVSYQGAVTTIPTPQAFPALVPKAIVERASYIYPDPTVVFGVPSNWQWTSAVIEEWGHVQVVIDGVDRTFLRDTPTTVQGWTTQSPYTWGTATLLIPRLTSFDNIGDTDTYAGLDVQLYKVNPDGSRGMMLFDGIIAANNDRNSGYGITNECQGLLNTASLAVCQPALGTITPTDLSDRIGDTLDGTPSRRFLATARTPTGILDETRGSLDQTRLDYVTGRLAQATTEDGAHSYTVVMRGGRPTIVEKDRTTVAYTVRAGQPGVELDLRTDATQTPNVIYGSGTDTDGSFWRNTKYPAAHPDDSLPYPFTDPSNVFTSGTTDGDTDSGSGVSDWQRRVNYLNVSQDVVIDGTYSAADEAACRVVQSHFGILVDGIVGPQTWDATFGVGSNVGDLNTAYIAPLAYIPDVERHTYYASGAVSGNNPAYDPDVLRVETYVTFGENIAKADAIRSARAQLARDYPPALVGSVTFHADPNECHRREIQADKVILLQGYQGRDVKLYISEADVDNLTGDVTCTVSEKALDLLSIGQIMTRDRDAKTDPAKQAFDDKRKSRQVEDTIVQWDSEDICGIVPKAALFGGLWSVLRIPFAQVADIAQTILTTTGTTFAVGVFGKPITASDLVRYVGDPLSSSTPWDDHADTLNDTFGLWMAWGTQDQPCGYYPKDASADGATVTGRMVDDGGFHFASERPPWAWVALYSNSSCFISGRFKFSVPN